MGEEDKASACGLVAGQPAASHTADSIPANYLALYKSAGTQYGVQWNLLAGIGRVETDHGRSTLPGVHSGANSAGAMGPMQFIGSTWAEYGNGGNVYNPADAIPAAARYLKASGAPKDLHRAIFAYNHSEQYVNKVMGWADKYAAGGFTVGDNNGIGMNCSALPGEGGSALAQAILAYAAKFLGVPYVWGGTTPSGFDCSGFVQYVYGHYGVKLPRTADIQGEVGTKMPASTPISQLRPGDLVFSYWEGPAGSNGIGHVMIYAGNGRMIGAHATAVSYQAINRFYVTHVIWYTRLRQLVGPPASATATPSGGQS